MTVTLRDVELELAEFSLTVSQDLAARTTAICGPSGAGKTSLLEVIAGLRTPERGFVRIAQRDVFDSERHVNVPPRLRRVGYVPQDDALFPHMSARANILYGSTQDDGLKTVAKLLEIESLLPRSVRHLSGGERKRVALARALLSRPEILLLDEPLAGVHSELRGRILEYLSRIRDEFAIPMIYVTHEIAEASTLCDEIVMLERGQIVRRDVHLLDGMN